MKFRPRIGVIIHYSTTNYGNHLVNYALRKMIEDRNYDVDLLVLDSLPQSKFAALSRIPLKIRRLGIRGVLQRISGRLAKKRSVVPKSLALTAAETKRKERFAEFSQNHLCPRFINHSDLDEVASSYDRVGIGSDQIWNFDYGISGSLFGNFVTGTEVVTFSPSVGHERLPAEWVSSYHRWISGFSEVGTRELEWTASLPGSTTTRFTLLIDPTLMYDAQFWESLAADQSSARNKILFYHLGTVLPQQAAYVAKLSEYHQLDVLHLSDIVGGPAWETSAGDFIGMIRDSSCVVTDSYHGAIFAFLFNKPLVLLERHGFAGAMNTRTRTLTDRLSLTDRYMNSLRVEDALTYDYSEGKILLDDYRKEYFAYLDRQGIRRVAHVPSQSNFNR